MQRFALQIGCLSFQGSDRKRGMMAIKRNIRLVVLLSVFSFFLAPTFSWAEEKVVASFQNKGFVYGYAEWKELSSIQTKKEGVVHLKGSAKGGAGIPFNDGLNLSSYANLELKIKKGSAGELTPVITLNLISKEGRSSWKIKTDSLSDSEFTLVKLKLSEPDTTGKSGKVNLSEIKNLQIQGNFNPGNQVDFEIKDIVAKSG